MSKERPRPDTAPKVGDGITKGVGSDSYPGTIIAVGKSGLSFHFQEDNAKVVRVHFLRTMLRLNIRPIRLAKFILLVGLFVRELVLSVAQVLLFQSVSAVIIKTLLSDG